MAKSAKKLTSSQAIESVLATLPAHRAGLPAKDTISGVTTAGKYTIIHTRELDQYDKGAMGPGLAAAAVPAPPTGDNFAGKIPVPVNVAAWGLFDALSLIQMLPLRVPAPVGVKLTAMLQLFPAARLAAQSLVAEKSPDPIMFDEPVPTVSPRL